MTWSRRDFLRISGVTATTSLVTATTLGTPAWAADEYDALRQRRVDMILGTGYSPTAEPYATKLAQAGQVAADYQAAMAPTTGSLWPDLPIGTVSANVTGTLGRLGALARAYALPGTGLTGDSGVLADVVSGLDWVAAHAYTATAATYDNWWDWQIGSPQSLLDTICLVYSALSSTQISTYLAAVDHYLPDSLVSAYAGTSTGANRVDLCRGLALRGVVGKNSAKIALARDALSPVFPLVVVGDGYYADGSFLQHTRVPYAGTYGAVLLGGLGMLFKLLAGSTWAVTDPNRQLVFDSVEKSYAPFLFNGLMMDGVSGRAISRGLTAADPLQIPQDDHTRGHGLVGGILMLADAASATERARWRGLVKGWLQRDYWKPFTGDLSLGIPTLAAGQAVLADSSVTAIAEPVNSKVFGAMDRATHRRAKWALAVSMCSSRTTYYETGNGENLHGWHTGNGMTYWWGDTFGNGQYSDSYWPTVDPYRLPGVTASRKALADAAGGAWGASYPATTWVGGATDGTYSALGQDTRGLQSTLTGKKSWFCLDDSVVCLGAGITCTDGVAVETTVDNRNLGPGTGNQAFTVDGVAQSTAMGWSATFTGADWACLSGFGGYLFPGGATVKALREARTGAWSSINTGGSTTALTRKYLTLWVDHGTDPVGSAYNYVLMPGADATMTAARAANPTVTTVSNTTSVQAIADGASGVTAANFFTAGTAGPITVSGPCSVLVRESGGTLRVSVADPTRSATTLTVTININGYATATGDPQVTVLGLAPIKLLVETGGALGASRTITFGTGSAVTPATPSTVVPMADAYVRDGSYASTNYGSDSALVVKNDATGYARRSFLKFDLSGLPAAPRRAILWVYGETADSAGTHTAFSAYGVSVDSWTETGVTWSTQPALGTVLDTRTIGDVKDWIPLDVTAFAQAQYAGDRILTVGLAAAAKSLAVTLNSRSNTVNPPFLEVLS
ncbi:MAG: polysaccharide lyase 8 family protein [Hamadaea sp.]|uniref:polysaccharide lyase family 8 super-sandwich domain-containing protein n=1 Tax=Hamadaea sp. TaxID=2024425 RepID=UPI0018362A8B|nr:polysaccharide lyase family 8 super-sandwich domain-containing protein [Hamadaea sp.]NUR69620.1 polysaccharide lyase 8 family protein [Hamadaea sp.]NUT24121.1 polysaccharide lyase 8 family protein [Hamadaea sp.]